MASGLVLLDEVKWISFQGYVLRSIVCTWCALVTSLQFFVYTGSYMDFGYLLKILTCQNLPDSESQFLQVCLRRSLVCVVKAQRLTVLLGLQDLETYFPQTYDIKYLMKSCKSLKGGLQDVADDLKVDRIGPQHQAGSDSLLTSLTFFKMQRVCVCVRGCGHCVYVCACS